MTFVLSRVLEALENATNDTSIKTNFRLDMVSVSMQKPNIIQLQRNKANFNEIRTPLSIGVE